MHHAAHSDHGQAPVLELHKLAAGQGIGVLAAAKGIEAKVSRHTLRALERLDDSGNARESLEQLLLLLLECPRARLLLLLLLLLLGSSSPALYDAWRGQGLLRGSSEESMQRASVTPLEHGLGHGLGQQSRHGLL